MGGYDYLSEGVKKKLKKLANSIQQEVGLFEPPIIYNDLYDNAKLRKDFISIDTLLQCGIITKADQKDNIRGVLSVQEKQVFVLDPTNYEKRHNFILAHELGHWMIPSHKALLYKCSQFDLSRAAQKQLEQEANFFAGELGFMGNLFTEYLMSSELNFNNIRNLSDLFGFSIESTLIRAVHTDLRPFAVRAMTIKKSSNGLNNSLTTKYLIHSTEFEKKLGKLDHTSIYNEEHLMSAIVNDPLISIQNSHKFKATLIGREQKLNVEMWKNKWSVFAIYTLPDV